MAIILDPTIGRRVALRPHLDLWMRGVRYVTIRDYVLGNSDRPTRYLVQWADRSSVWLDADDIDFN